MHHFYVFNKAQQNSEIKYKCKRNIIKDALNIIIIKERGLTGLQNASKLL